jgi:glycyl-tRNA synthetase alpha chain
MPEGEFAAFHRDMFTRNYDFARGLVDSGLVLPALDYCLKCSHLFNVLDSSGSIGATERTAYILRVRQLAVAIARGWTESGVTEDAVHGS